MRTRYLFFGLFAVLRLPAADLAEDAAAVLQGNCTACHGADKQMGNLDLRTLESALEGGERGLAVQPGKSEDSRLYRFIAGLEKPSMPPGKRLSTEDVEAIRKWIDDGAKLPASAKTEAAPAPKHAINTKMEERIITPEDRKYWAFVPPARAPLPAVGASNPIDAFILSTLQAKKLKPGGAADRRSLIRRAYLDLTGLPPSPAKVQEFLNDRTANAFSKVVEELLASAHYGERWGRHWLDTVRYSDSGGFEYDRDRDNGWRYRDYVVKAFNTDKPFNKFVQEQLAGDEIAPDSQEARIATGYLRLGLENNLKNEQTRMDELDDLVATTSNTFLGLTVGCARCHNHKFDPIAQKDYYRMQAVFFSTKATEYPLVGKDEIARFEAEQKRIGQLQAPFKAQLTDLEKPYKDKIIAEKKSKLPEYVVVALQTPKEQRTEGQRLNAEQVEKTLKIVDQKDILATMSAADLLRHKEIAKQIAELEAQRPPTLPTAMAIAEKGRDAAPSYFLYRGSPDQKGSQMQPGVIAVASHGEWNFPQPPADATTSWRRTGLANWIADAENPLTARVMVNRIWQHHFGEGIVRTPNNFGKMGERPTHPELLDWLATEFVKQNWSIKAMHRLIMNSDTYQRSSDDVAANLAIDGENRYFWRMPRQRLEAEIIRDSMMAVAGNLDLKVGGPAVHPYIDPALFQSSSKRTWVGKADSDPETWRRGVYIFSKRSIPLPMFDVFDKPDSVGSCARRNRSTIAPQALILMNNKFVLMEAQLFAERLRREAGSDPTKQTNLAFELALNRPPTSKETATAVSFIRGDDNGLVDFCQTMLNLNEFVYIP